MIFNSIRWRVQAWHGLILVFVLTGFGATAYHVVRENQLRRIDDELRLQFNLSFRPRTQEGPPPEFRGRPLEGPPPEGPPPLDFRARPEEGRPPEEHRRERGKPPFEPSFPRTKIREWIQGMAAQEGGQTNAHYFVFWEGDRIPVARSPNTPADVPWTKPTNTIDKPSPRRDRDSPEKTSLSRPGFAMATMYRSRGVLRELVFFMPHNDCLLIGRSIAPDLAALKRLAYLLSAAGLGVLLLGLVGGWWLAARAIRPIEDISATALKIAAGDLSQRINVEDTDSELGRLAGVLNSTFGRLEAAFANQVRFTSDASHELRTPVTVILTKTQTALSRERAAPEYREALEACQRAAQRMRRLTESLLELARLDAGQEPVKRQPFDLARVARECVELVRPLAAERQIEIHSDLPVVVCPGDAELISQVVTNLLTNAIHFNQAGGSVRVSVHTGDGVVCLTVTDNGVGIPPEDLPHLFERFYRGDKSRSRINGSNGLGLAICRAIVQAHSGALEVTSQVGKGSTFTLRLPLQ